VGQLINLKPTTSHTLTLGVILRERLEKNYEMKPILTSLNFLLILFFLTGCHSGYEEKDGKVYHKWIHGGNWTKEYSLMEEADATSFTTIKHDLNIDLGKDKNHVYKDGSIIGQANPSTFEQVKEYYWKDAHHVFLLQFGGTNCVIQNADPRTFQVIDNNLWAKDNVNIYYGFDKLSDVNTEEFVANNEEWGNDKSYYFYHNLRLDSLDYESAEIVNSYFMEEPARTSDYIKDKNHVFFQNRLVKDANPLTFVADGIGTFGHDDTYMFDWEKNVGPITEQYRKTYIEKK
jgi:hypothetical protein